MRKLENKMFNIKNKRILLVGASGVLGSEYTEMFLREGTRLIVSDVDLKSTEVF